MWPFVGPLGWLCLVFRPGVTDTRGPWGLIDDVRVWGG